MILELALSCIPVAVVVLFWGMMRPVHHRLHPVPAVPRRRAARS
ncbi:MAG TPA: hypothetical protein VFM53_09455 [Anaeromyxobacteraceae bacterium]|nr:hypothetical protein [Anaeromyxobacteraceae bacterium]